jgi:hypothetical protein
MAPKETMTFYYRTTIPDETGKNAGSVYLQTIQPDNDSISSMQYFDNKFMCKADFKTFTTDIISGTGYRLPGNKSLGTPAMFSETITITSRPYQSENGSNMITAFASYIDSGITPITTVEYVNYTVTGASGKFVGYKNIKIIYDKDKIRRTVILS